MQWMKHIKNYCHLNRNGRKYATVNRVTASFSNLDTKLGNITQALACEVFQVGQFVQLYLQLTAIIKTARHTIWQAKFYMEHIQLQLNMLSLGHLSPSVITPSSLKALLVEIENHLPQFLQLPSDQRGDIWKMYQTLACTTVHGKGHLLVIVSKPLLDKSTNLKFLTVSACLYKYK